MHCICRIQSHVSNTLSSGITRGEGWGGGREVGATYGLSACADGKGSRCNRGGTTSDYLYWLCRQLTATVTYVTGTSRYRWFKHETSLHQQLRIFRIQQISIRAQTILSTSNRIFEFQENALRFHLVSYAHLIDSCIIFKNSDVQIDRGAVW